MIAPRVVSPPPPTTSATNEVISSVDMHVAVDLRVAQLGDDVHADLIAVVVVQEGRVGPPLLHQRSHVPLEILTGDEAVVVGVAAAEAGHHRVVPPGELLASLLGDAEHLGDHADRELVGETSAEFDDRAPTVELDPLGVVGQPPLLDQLVQRVDAAPAAAW